VLLRTLTVKTTFATEFKNLKERDHFEDLGIDGRIRR
jgi:hypothetical protein